MRHLLFAAAFWMGWTNLSGQTTSPSEWSVAELIGLNEPSKDPAFAPIPAEWCSRDGLYLRTEARDAFLRMAEAAALDGVRLVVVSAARNFTYQNGIWSRKWARSAYEGWSDYDKALDILKYSAMPGSSRHHWGTDLDLNNLENSWFQSGEGLRVATWLEANAARFGYHQVYTEDPHRTGYLPERWHWSYVPLAGPMLAAYNECVGRAELESLNAPGMDLVDSLRILSDFVNGIAPVP